jgi:hypothetical protein
MPTVVPTPIQGYAHCRDARCPGYAQEAVPAVREEASYTFGENGGDGIFTHMIESSRVEYVFADAGDAPCPVCSVAREVTAEPRPQYINESGHDPMGLLGLPKFNASEVPAAVGESDDAMEARLRREIAEERMRERLRAEMTG